MANAALGLDPVFLACLLGGLLGGIARAVSTWNQDTVSRRSLSDLFVGSALSVFLPFITKKLPLAPPDLLAQITPALWFVASLTFGYTVASLVTNWITNYIVQKTKGVVA
jgi:hypothetical protein